MRLLRGRWITDADREGAPDVVVVNQTLAKRYWPNEDAIGKRINYRAPGSPPSTIVGIVADIHHTGLDQPVRPEMYLSYLQSPSRRMWVVVRTEGDAPSIIPDIRAAVRRLDSEQPIASQTTLEAIVSQSVAMPRLFVTFFGFFASVALLLAAVGIYGVTANAVMQRTQEIGIRIALGANARTVVASILGRAMLIAGAGLAVGIGGALALSGALRRLLFDLSPTDPETFAVIAIILAAVVLLASWTPARRAATVDPMKALRVE
jgi:putative ABC transport system permease protein